jgi:ceramide glucosyltransferase
MALGYQIQALLALKRFFRTSPKSEINSAPVTILKPLYGQEPQLTANLASFLAQDYSGPVQLLCGVGNSQDSAITAAKALQNTYPDAHITLTTGPRAAGANGKIGNLISMMPSAQHDILILSDSDMVARPDYLNTVISALNQPDVGAVSCLYIGRGDAGLWSEIGAAAISTWGMPSIIMSLATGIARPCMGSTIALRRETLDKIGGFVRFADVLGDDNAIGAAVREQGLTIEIPPYLIIHAGDERSFPALWQHHLRWAVTVRDIAGFWPHLGSVVTHGLPLALLAAIPTPTAGIGAIALILALRYAMLRQVSKLAGYPVARFSHVICADLLIFTAFCASFFARKIDWRGAALTVSDGGQISAAI